MSQSSRRKKVMGATAGGDDAAGASGGVVESCGMRRETSPTGDAHEAKAVERGAVVVGDAAGEDVALPGAGGDFKALQLAQSFEQSVLAAQGGAGCEVLPAQQPMHELGRRYWLNLLAQGCDGEAVDAREEAAVTPLERSGGAAEMAAKDGSGGFQAQKGGFDGGGRDPATIGVCG